MFETTHSPEERLARVEKLVEEMHGMMKAERRSRRIGAFFKLIYWGAFLYGTFWAYQNYLIPMLNQASQTLAQVQEMQNTVKESTNKINAGINGAKGGIDTTKLQEMLKSISSFMPQSSTTTK